MLLSDRVAIVTGGARGIGKGIALRFADEGSAVIIADVLQKEGKATADELAGKGGKSLFIECDVSNSGQVERLVEQALRVCKKVDILVNNAGIGPLPLSITAITEEQWDRVMAVNLKGAFLCSRAVIPAMKRNGYGRIINISSMAAIAPPAPNCHYSAAKAGILGFTRDLALELAPFNICVNAILPGAIRTDMFDSIIPPGVEREAFYAEMGKVFAPMQRMGTPDDIAGAALFLASGLSGYVTGDRLLVGGGSPLISLIK
jgi:NAD(P)-dependent dehydrogenase (short-subunit alcohol dehydrogenase family)